MAALTSGALVVFLLIAVALVLFVTEWLPPDMTAIGILVSLVVLEPLTGVPAGAALAGFASPAVVTIIGMYVLSGAIEQTGVVTWLGARMAAATGGNERSLLGATLGSTGLAAGIVNNTPVVAVFIPMISDLADEAGISPSKFLMPLSFAAMLGGTLTLVGTSLNLLASDISGQLLNRPLGVFEITPLGVLVLVIGLGYLLTIGYRLTPARVAPRRALVEAYDLESHLAKVRVREASPLIGRTPTDIFLEQAQSLGVLVLQIERDGAVYIAGEDRPIEPGDVLTVRANTQAINRIAGEFDLQQLPRAEIDDKTLEIDDHPGMLAEVVLPPDSAFIGTTPTDADLVARYDTSVLAIRRGETIHRENVAEMMLERGDTLLLQTTESALAFLQEDGDIILTDTVADPPEVPTFAPDEPQLGWQAGFSVATLLLVVAVAAGTRIAIPVAALGGVVAVVAAGCLRPADVYDAVNWNVIFLLAGVLPLGIALDRTGGAAVIGELLGGVAAGLPPLGAIALVYLIASILAAAITPVATVVLLTPIAIDVAGPIGAAPFAFVLASLFGASAAYLTPIGYQTNLMVYGPGGYRFTDFARVGAPLLVILTVVTTLGIAGIYGL
ncbi:MAG: SLC13 family permease [Salinirussus sp.]